MMLTCKKFQKMSLNFCFRNLFLNIQISNHFIFQILFKSNNLIFFLTDMKVSVKYLHVMLKSL